MPGGKFYWNVLVTSSAEQAETMHGVTEAVIAALASPHWQVVSVRPHDVVAIAVAKQETFCCMLV